MAKDLDIEAIIDEEIEKARIEEVLIGSPDRFDERTKVIKQIANRVFQQVSKFDSAIPVFSILRNLLDRLKFPNHDKVRIFCELETKISKQLDEAKKSAQGEQDWLNCLTTLRFVAVDYFKSKIRAEIEGLEIAEALIFIKKKPSILKFHKPAVQEILKELETEIALARELNDLKAEFASHQGSLKKHDDATLTRVVLALNYLLNEAGVANKLPSSKRINFIDFVTPYSRNTIKPQLTNLHEKASKNPTEYRKDMALISKYFKDLGLSKIVEQINRDRHF